MGTHEIRTPTDTHTSGKGGSVFLRWSLQFGSQRTGMFNRKQQVVDSEVLRYCDPLVPKITGELIRSGTRGTVIGSGNVQYTAPYARFQYYQTAQSRSYDSRRGAFWFKRMKAAHKADILRAAERS